jgi:hypothetical protein
MISAPNCRMDPSGWAVARWLWCTDDDAIDGHPIFPESLWVKSRTDASSRKGRVINRAASLIVGIAPRSVAASHEGLRDLPTPEGEWLDRYGEASCHCKPARDPFMIDFLSVKEAGYKSGYL